MEQQIRLICLLLKGRNYAENQITCHLRSPYDPSAR
jgi:hypothetical protein